MLTRDLVSLDLVSIVGTDIPGVNLEVQDLMRVLGLCHQSVIIQWLKLEEVVFPKFWRLEVQRGH